MAEGWKEGVVLAGAVRCLVVALVLLVDPLIADYDESDDGHPFDHWDGVWFRSIASEGYTADLMHVFYPAYPFLRRLVPYPALLSNLCFVGSAALFSLLTNKVWPDSPPAFHRAARVAYALTPSGIFVSVGYSESLFALLSMAGMLCWASRRSISSVPFFALASLTRSNGAFLAGFHMWDAIALRRPLPAFLALLSATPGFLYQVWAHHRTCLGPAVEQSVVCPATPSSFYSALQREYWGVAPFAYYTVKQLPNFALAAPVLAVVAVTVRNYAKHTGARAFFALCWGEGDRRGVFVWHLLGLTVIAMAMAHIQITPRLLVGCPALYWGLAHLLTSPSPRTRRLVLTYLLSWQAVGAILFPNFYPWT